MEILGATHTHFASVCWIGDYLISIGFTQDRWAALGAADLIEPYEVTCGPEAFPIEESNRLAQLYTVAFFKRHLLGERGYDAYLTSAFAVGEVAIEFSGR